MRADAGGVVVEPTGEYDRDGAGTRIAAGNLAGRAATTSASAAGPPSDPARTTKSNGLRFQLTQEFLAQMLGVRRSTVSLTAGLLHNAGLISYTRGVITITDRPGLEDVACECYEIVRDPFDQLARPE
jgi:Crp-like helix-turn-helix domain